MTMQEKTPDVVVIGAGPAGLTAALYLKRAGLTVLLIKGKGKGGLEWAKEISNYPGFVSISGKVLLARMIDQVKGIGVEVLEDEVIALSLSTNPKMVSTKKAFITANVVVISIGRGARKPVLVGEEEFIGRGVSYCASCDGPVYVGKNVCIIGDDEEAAHETLVLAQMGCNVTWLLHNAKSLEKTDLNQVILDKIKEKKVLVIEGASHLCIDGESKVDAIEYQTSDGGASKLETSCIFVMTSVPTMRLLQDAGIEISDKNAVVVDRSQKTNLPGVYACGDVCGNGFQVSIAVGEGAVAAMNAAKFLLNGDTSESTKKKGDRYT